MYFENWFIKNENILLETSNCDDLLDWESDITKFSNRIDELKWSLIWWIVWQFWVWKSTLINNVKNRRNNEKHDEKRFEFDAWKYPDRKDLREWFVLDFAKQVNEKSFNEAVKYIDWKQNDDKKTLASVVWTAVSLFVPWWNAISNLSYFFNTSPARRVFEIQEIFQKLLKNIKENKIIIVVEDIDRSWDAGIFFLETLKQFITKNDFWKEILVIMPLWTDEYYKNLDSYLKPIDYFDFFNPWIPTLDTFIKWVFIDEILNNTTFFQPLKEFLEWLFEYYPNNINMRKLKLILRKANQNHLMMIWKYDEQFKLDWRLNIIFETIKYIDFDNNNESLFYRCNNKWFGDNPLITAYLYNLLWQVKRQWYNIPYNWDTSTLYDKVYDELNWEMVTVLNNLGVIGFKFWKSITYNEMIWWLFGWDFRDKIENFVIPESYLEY